MGDQGKGICFVICPIGDEGTPERQRSNDVFDFIIKPVAEALGYRPQRTIEAPRPGWITERIIQHLTQDPMVVADLTDRNPNVFYELAIRHAAQKPFVQIMQEGQEVPFDVYGLETIFFDLRNIRSVEEAKGKLTRQIRTAEDEPEKIRTPVSIARDLLTLGASTNPIQSLLRDLVAQQGAVMERLDLLSDLTSGFRARDPSSGRRSYLPSDSLRRAADEIARKEGLKAVLDVDRLGFVDPRNGETVLALDLGAFREMAASDITSLQADLRHIVRSTQDRDSR